MLHHVYMFTISCRERTPWAVSTFLPEWSTLIHYFFTPWGVEGNSWKEWPLVLNQHTRRDTTHMTERNLLHWKGTNMPPQTSSTTLTVTAVSIGGPLSRLFLRNKFSILVGRVAGKICSVRDEVFRSRLTLLQSQWVGYIIEDLKRLLLSWTIF